MPVEFILRCKRKHGGMTCMRRKQDTTSGLCCANECLGNQHSGSLTSANCLHGKQSTPALVGKDLLSTFSKMGSFTRKNVPLHAAHCFCAFPLHCFVSELRALKIPRRNRINHKSKAMPADIEIKAKRGR